MDAGHRRQVSLMFSGGVDSTMAAVRLAAEYDVVHLLTWQNGYGHYHLGRTRRRVRELRRHFGDRFRHTMESVQPLFEEMTRDLEGDFSRYGSGFIWCLSCKMAMHTRSIQYNLAHGVETMADGSSGSSSEMVEQSLLAVEMVREMYARWGIEYRTPVYSIPREEEITQLRAMGFRMGIRVGDRFLGVQPKCRPGELYYLPFLLLNQFPKHDPSAVAAFLREKQVVMADAVEAYCRANGIDGVPLRAAAGGEG